MRFDPWVGKIPCRKAGQRTLGIFRGESPWTEESGGLNAIGSQRIRCNQRDLTCRNAQISVMNNFLCEESGSWFYDSTNSYVYSGVHVCGC